MSQPGSPSEFDLSDYLRILRRRKWIIVITTVTMAMAALSYSWLQTPVYSAHANVLLQPRTADQTFAAETGFRNDPARLVDTEIQVLKSRPVREAVRTELGFPATVSAQPVGQTDMIEVSGESTNRKQAADIASAYARAYVDFRRKQAIGDLVAASEEFQTKVSDLQRQVEDLERQVASAPSAERESLGANLRPRQDSLLEQQLVFKQRLDQLQVDAALTSGRAQLVSEAEVPKAPVAPRPRRNFIMGGVLGMILGVGLVFVREHLDDSIKDKDALTRATGGVPVVGLIPEIQSWKARGETRVVSMADPRSPATEAYRTLRTSIQFLALDRPVRLLQMTSAVAEEGKTTTLANLGVAMSGAGQRVVIACCDLRRPRIHEFFGLTNEVGLTSVLLGEAPMSAALQQVPGQEGLWILASGPLPPNPSELLASPRLADGLDALKSRCDIVLIDSPPILPVTDGLILSGRVDATILACYAGVTTQKQLGRAFELLRQVDAPLLGTVLNGVSTEDSYGYAYQYYRYERSEPLPQPTNGERKWRRRGTKIGA